MRFNIVPPGGNYRSHGRLCVICSSRRLRGYCPFCRCRRSKSSSTLHLRYFAYFTCGLRNRRLNGHGTEITEHDTAAR